MTHRINRRRINHLRTEVTKLHRLYITQFGNGISGADDTWVGGHKSVHIGPDFQHIGIQCRGNDRSGIVRTAPSQIGHLTRLLISRDKSRHQRHTRNFAERFTYQAIGQFRVENMLVMFLLGLDELARIEPLRPLDKCSHNDRRQTLAIAHDSSRSLGRKVAYQVNALENVLQFTQ